MDEGYKYCPYCAEKIKTQAVKCRHCESKLPEKEKCSNCGTDLEDIDYYCSACGAPVKQKDPFGPPSMIHKATSGKKSVPVGLVILIVAVIIAGAAYLLLPLLIASSPTEVLPVDQPVEPPTRKASELTSISVPLDYATIQEAIDTASNGDTIVVEPGTYRENIDFKGKNIILRSTDPNDPEVVNETIIDGENNGSVVSFKNGEGKEAVLSGFTITGGSGTWKEGTFEYKSEKVEYKNYYGGGVLVCDGSSPVLKNNIISGNAAGGGGGVFIAGESFATLEGNTVKGNNASRGGGGIFVTWKSSAAIKDNIIEDNKSEGGGGGVIVISESSATIEGNTIRRNTTEGSGGGIAVFYDSFATIERNIIEDNSAGNGGGIAVFLDSSAAVVGNTIGENRAIYGGGVAVQVSSSVVVENNTFKNNHAKSNGGVIWLSDDSTMDLSEPDNNTYSVNTPDDIYRQ